MERVTEGLTPQLRWRHARGTLRLARPGVMAIVNLTPDSFFDGGQLLCDGVVAVDAARSRARALVDDGADLLDLGGESTRPGARPVARARLARVVPVIAALADDVAVPLSVDTRHAEVARMALEAGAAIVNDVSGLADPAMIEVVAERGAGLVIGHLRGVPRTMQRDVAFVDAIGEVTDELGAAVERAVSGGISRAQLVVDPGLGFGKTAEQSAALLGAGAHLERALGCPVMIGASRKSFLGVITGKAVRERGSASVAAAVVAVRRGAALVRVHDVAQTVDALRVCAAADDAWARAGREASP